MYFSLYKSISSTCLYYSLSPHVKSKNKEFVLQHLSFPFPSPLSPLSLFLFPSLLSILLSSLSSFPFLLSPLFPFVVVGLGFAQRGLGFVRRSRPGCGGLRRSQCGGGAVGVIVGLPIFKC
jgi:hypothetical protein